MKKLVVMVAILMFAGFAQAKPAFTGQNYSGTYSCKGNNEQVGDYEVKVTMKLNRVSSYGKFGAYYYETETENSVIYSGHAAADGSQLAITLLISDTRYSEPSLGVATMKRDKKKRWTFSKRYYEPDDNGGSFGTEYCVIQPAKKSNDL